MMRRILLAGAGAALALGTTGLMQPAIAAPMTIRIATVTSPGNHYTVALNWFADRVNKDHVGVTMKVLAGAQLGGERSYIEGMMLGTIQMAQTSTAPMSEFIPEFDLFSLPYIFNSTEQFKNVVSGPVAEKFNKLAEKRGLKIIAWFDNGYRSVFNQVRPVYTPKDMKGLKIRTMQSPVMVKTIDDMGGEATPMSYSQLYTALSQGVVNGAENAPGNVLHDKFYEVSKYFSLTRQSRPPGVVCISLKTWTKLTPHQQAVLTKEGKALQTYEIDQTTKLEAQALKELKAKGMKINTVDVAAFKARMKPLYKKFDAKFGPELLDMVRNTK